MVSSEGACAAYFSYGRHLELLELGTVEPEAFMRTVALDNRSPDVARQPVSEAGLTQASSVIPLVKWSELESLIVTQLLVPLKDSPWP
jgi:hypothetical protein